MTLVQNGKGAAIATLTLMRDVARILPPRDIIDIYEQSFADDTTHTTALWTRTGTQTGKVMAMGIRTLAMLWEAAWTAGGGHINAGQVTRADLKALYENTNFLRSAAVNDVEHEILHPAPLNT